MDNGQDTPAVPVGQFPKDDEDRSGSGIGLKNLSRRLEMLYPGKYSFEYGKVRDIYQSILKIKSL